MKKTIFRRMLNRFLHTLAQTLPGATTLRPFLHKLRGVKISGNIMIFDDAYIENEYPELVEIHSGVHIGIRSMILAHFGGKGKVIIEKNAEITANCMVAAHAGQTLRIGEGSFVAASSLVIKDVPPFTMVAGVPAKPIALVGKPWELCDDFMEFKKNLKSLK